MLGKWNSTLFYSCPLFILISFMPSCLFCYNMKCTALSVAIQMERPGVFVLHYSAFIHCHLLHVFPSLLIPAPFFYYYPILSSRNKAWEMEKKYKQAIHQGWVKYRPGWRSQCLVTDMFWTQISPLQNKDDKALLWSLLQEWANESKWAKESKISISFSPVWKELRKK